MINSPNFAQTSGTFNTFSLNGQNDPRMVLWHVDRYVRNIIWNREWWRYGEFTHSLERSFPIHVLRHEEPRGWPDREMMEQAWEEEDFELMNQANIISTAWSWGAWMPFMTAKPENFPNLSLTRYDWRTNTTPAFYWMGGFERRNGGFVYGNRLPTPQRLPMLFAIENVDLWTGKFEPWYLTRSKCGKLLHGPSWEIRIKRIEEE